MSKKTGCVDCGTKLVFCEHALNRLLEPPVGFLSAELEAANASLAAMTARAEAAEARIALLEPLVAHAQHDPGCYAMESRQGEALACKCGFYDERIALAALASEVPALRAANIGPAGPTS